MNQAEEDLLVIAAQSGDRKAFAQIYQHYRPLLVRFAFKVCGDESLAQDATQEAWLATATKIRHLRDPRAFRCWIYRQVRWRLLDVLRKSRRSIPLDEQGDTDLDTKLLEQQIEQSRDLSNALQRLPRLEREIIHLFYLDDMSVQEIALIIQVPQGTVKSRLNRARRLLKQKFEC